MTSARPPCAYRVVMAAGRLPGRAWLARGRGLSGALGTVALGVMLAACAGPTPSPSPSVDATVAPSPGESAAPSVTPVPSPTPFVAVPLEAPGTVVVLQIDGTLALIDAESGARTPLAIGGAAGFAAWSPDGDRIASIQVDGASSIRLFDVAAAVEAGGSSDPEPAPIEPTVLVESEAFNPFYLSWAPDGSTVSYLASTESGIALRLVPADGSAPVDGSDPAATVGAGNPLYYDWIGSDRLLAHVGTGPGALLGEIDLTGESVGPPLGPPGTFRSAVISHDQQRVAFVRQDAAGDLAVVVSDRDGDNEQSMPVFGQAAMAFHPTSDSLAAIGPIVTLDPPVGFPLGPLRVLEDGAAEPRLLLDGAVVGFWWSPDGSTMAAIRVQEPELPIPGRTSEIRLLFVDVASGEVTAQSIVELGPVFVDQFIGFFDQYALSHQLWSPDSNAFLLPVVDGEGRSQIAVSYRDGRDPLLLAGVAAFWSP